MQQNLIKDIRIIPAEKLLLAALNASDSSNFDQLFTMADLSKVTRKDLLAIVKDHPETLEKFISADIAPEFLLMAATAINDKNAFDALLIKCDISKLYGHEITEIILQFDIQVINQLAGYHFHRLTITDLEKIETSLGIEAIKEIANYNVSPSILLSALKSGMIELFNELATKVDLTKLEAYQKAEMIKNALNTKQFEWIKALLDAKFAFSEANAKDQSLIEQLEKCYIDAKCHSECFTKEENFSTYNVECVSQFTFIDSEL